MAETTASVAASNRVAGSAQALLVVDETGTCVEVSLGASRLLGLSRAEVVGRPVESLLEHDSRERFGHVWQAFRESGGHAEPFALGDAGSDVEVGITVIAGVLPDRHLIRFDSISEVEGTAVQSPVDGLEPDAELPGEVDRETTEATAPRPPTAREREVLALLAGGATDGQIATMLQLSPATVQTHVRNAKAKLGARTRAQAVALAIQRALITPR
jgi:DNA-binding CsgD family transcriptional regulator